MQPFLSICIPTYNRAEYLRRCLTSLASQPGDFEVVISDNASPDHTPDVVAEFSMLQIRYVRQAENVGAVENFVRAIGLAEGEYVCVVADDDWAVPGAISTLTAWLSRHRPDVMKCDLIALSDSRRSGEHVERHVGYSTVGKEIKPDDGDPDGARQLLSVFHTWTGLCFRRRAIDYEMFVGHRPKWYPQLLILGMLHHRPGYLPEPLFVHRSDSELFAEALDDAGLESFLEDLATTFELLGSEMDPDLMAGMSRDALRRLSLNSQRVMNDSSVAQYLGDGWPATRRRLRMVVFLNRGGTSAIRRLRRVRARLVL